MRPDLSPWRTPSTHPVLEAGHIHLWRFSLDLSKAEINHLKQLLSDDELVRANRLLDPKKSQQFIVARARLRQILARYFDQSASSLQFSYGSSGKPQISTSLKPLFFNLSHAGSWALLAISGDDDLGVDIEYIDPAVDFVKIMRQFFAATDLTRWMNSPPPRRHREFYRIWTAREAVLKTCGTGFSTSSAIQRCHYKVRNFPLFRNYLGALATKSTYLYIDRWNLPQAFTK